MKRTTRRCEMEVGQYNTIGWYRITSYFSNNPENRDL